MSSFERAIPIVLVHEGGYVNDPADPGGATNFGVSLRYLISCGGLKFHPELDLNHDGKLDYLDIRAMSKDQAVAVYRRDWWDAEHYGNIADDDCATKVFDLSVNMGHIRAHKLAQTACRACGQNILPDGKLGPLSIAAINHCEPLCFLFHIRDNAALFYRSLAARNPKLSKFLPGWLRRAYS
jgi:lysozyme family protein